MAACAMRALLALFAAVVCTLLLQGCGSGGNDGTTTHAPKKTTTMTTTTSAAPTTTTTTATTETTTTTAATTTTTSSTSKPKPAPVPRKASEVVKVPGWPDMPGKFPLSFAIKTDSMVYASGLQGSDMKTMKLVPGGVGAETNQTLLNLEALLKAAGSSLQDVVQCSVSLINITRDFKAMNAAYSTFWPKDPPARVAVEVAALAGSASVEIQCDAALQGHGREVVKVPGLPDLAAKGFPLSFATKANGMVYLSGSQGMNFSTGKLVPGGVGSETTQTLRNLQQVLEAAGSSIDRVTGCSVSLVDMGDFDEMNAAYKEFWPKQGILGGLPSRVCVQVSALAGEGKVEIQCTAAGAELPSGRAPKAIKVPGWPEMHGFPFSAATTAGGMAYISGNQGVDMKTSKLVDGGPGPETTQTLKDIKAAVEAAGTTLEEVVSCEVSLRDMSDFSTVNRAYQRFWPSDPPSRVAVQVKALARGAAVEIRCAAALPSKATHIFASELVI